MNNQRCFKVILTVVLILILCIYHFPIFPYHIFIFQYVEDVGEVSCKGPELILWPPDMIALNTNKKPIQCEKKENQWVAVEDGKIRLKNLAKRYPDNVTCSLTVRTTKEELETNNKLYTKLYTIKSVEKIRDGMDIPYDYFIVNCVFNNNSKGETKKYKSLFLDLVRNDKVNENPPPSIYSEPQWNILIWVFDSLSKHSWHRFLPKTIKAFEGMGGVWMDRVNVLGPGTINALLPMLAGKNEHEVHSALRGYSKASHVDDYPWFWNYLKDLDYVTLYDEQSTFQWQYLGFKKTPSHHYGRPWFLQAEYWPSKASSYCIGSKMKVSMLHDRMNKFWRTYSNHPKFALVNYQEMSHDSFIDIQYADEPQSNWIQTMHDQGFLDNTIFVLMSDHGAKRGIHRHTKQADFEVLNPYFGIRLPKAFEKLHPEDVKSLRNNANRLVTAYDLHGMFADIIKYITDGKVNVPVHPGSISLLQNIPRNRSCENAYIKPEYCLCNEFVKVSEKSLIAKKISEAMVTFINEKVRPIKHLCSKSTLLKIISISSSFRSRILNGGKDYLFKVTISVNPSKGIFQGFTELKKLTILPNEKVNLTTVNRISTYGPQPHCIYKSLPYLAPFCYCKKQL